MPSSPTPEGAARPGARDVIASRLEVEAEQLRALAAMVRDGDVKTPKELDEDYLPHRIEALQRCTAVFPESKPRTDSEIG